MSLKLQSLAGHSSLYSVQDAFLSFKNAAFDAQDNPTVTLYSDGCLLDGGSRNCSVACRQASLIFESTATLHNCLHYPVIAGALSIRNLESESLAIAASYGIDEEDADLPMIANNTTTTIQRCLTDYCGSTPGCSKPEGSSRTGGVPVTVCNGETCYNHTNICQGVYAPVIDDIAGVGVSTTLASAG